MRKSNLKTSRLWGRIKWLQRKKLSTRVAERITRTQKESHRRRSTNKKTSSSRNIVSGVRHTTSLRTLDNLKNQFGESRLLELNMEWRLSLALRQPERTGSVDKRAKDLLYRQRKTKNGRISEWLTHFDYLFLTFILEVDWLHLNSKK